MKFIRDRVLRRELMFGVGAQLASSLTVEMIGAAGFDWTWIDCEHGAGDHSELITQIQVAALGNAPPVVRIAWNEAPRFKRVLDLGASGIMVPYVNNRAEAQLAAQSMRYQPEGIRGVAQSPRSCGFGRNFEEYFAKANDNLLTVVQIETREAVENAQEIAAVPGIDVLFVGPFDLSVNMEIIKNFDHPEFVSALQRVAAACRQHDKTAGILTPGLHFLSPWIEMGYTFFVVGSDSGCVTGGLNQIYSACKKFK
jgi:2-keto-3-deoxy-L-rhamnonate aldolase RhmA